MSIARSHIRGQTHTTPNINRSLPHLAALSSQASDLHLSAGRILQSGDLVRQSTGRRSTVTLSTVTQSTVTQSAIRQSTVPQSTSRTSHGPIAHSASTTTTTTTATLSANLIASPRCRPASLRACYAARLALLPHLARSDDAHVWDDRPRSSPCRKKRQNAQANNTETYYLAPPEAAAPPCKISAVSR